MRKGKGSKGIHRGAGLKVNGIYEKKFLFITALLVLIITFSIKGTVLSQSKDMAPIDKKYCRMMENEYIARIRIILKEQGYSNSGITMTKITEENKESEYTVLIHHKKIMDLEEREKDSLKEKLSEVSFPVEGSFFVYRFLETEK